MSYKPVHNYRRKDRLDPGDPDKIIYGSDLQDEFDAISKGVEALEGQIEEIQEEIGSGGGSGGGNPQPLPDGNDSRISDEQIVNWDEAYGWGDHSAVGYLTSEEDPTVPDHVKAITEADIQKWDSGSGGGGYDDTEIRGDLAQEVEDRKDGDQFLQDQIDSLGGGGSGVEEAPEDGKQYARIDASWEQVSAVTVDENEPADPVTGQLWYKPSEGEMYVYDGTGWKSFGSADGGGGTDPNTSEQFLIVAGGGGGGSGYAGGGGGAGGYLLYNLEPSDLPTGQTLQITVGAGGVTFASHAGNGSDSSILETNGSGRYWGANGGGAGGSYNYGAGLDGGSGGGSTYNPAGGGKAETTGKNGSPDCLGHDGSDQYLTGIGSGGGGAHEAGHDSSSNASGKGGDGLPCSITGEEVYYAGGGAGGNQGGYGGPSQGGLGGGGYDANGIDGLGGGGGGTNADAGSGFSGGDGIVIIRTKKKGTVTSGDCTITRDGDYEIYSFVSSGEIQF